MELKINSFQKHKRLSVIQFTAFPANTLDYISGPTAVKDNLIQIKEVSQAGSVNNLNLFNLSDKFVFFMDGDILSGAKQNRVLNTSVFIAPNSKINLPVSCIEQGRWSAISDRFAPTDYLTPQKLRAKKAKAVDENLSAERGFMAEQREVWNDVDSYAAFYKVVSPTMSLTDVYEKKKKDFDSFIKNFPSDADSNGLAIFTDRDLLNIDLFNKTDIYQEYFPRILRSTAMEIASLKEKANEIRKLKLNLRQPISLTILKKWILRNIREPASARRKGMRKTT